jgi:hypothetical protein
MPCFNILCISFCTFLKLLAGFVVLFHRMILQRPCQRPSGTPFPKYGSEYLVSIHGEELETHKNLKCSDICRLQECKMV